MKPLFILLFSLFFILHIEQANAAACCGGGSASPSLIAGDDKAMLTTSYALTEVVVNNVDSSGVWRKWDDHQNVKTFKIEGAHLISDLWQAGFSLPVIERSQQDKSYTGLADVTATLGYEYLPEWNYNPYRPKGIGFLQIVFPTGKSKADSEVGGLDSRGNGFWSLGFGTLLTKSWVHWDVLAACDVHQAFGKKINTSQIQGHLKPGVGGNFGLGAGYNLTDYRFGSSITWAYEDPIDIESETQTIKGSIERYATANLSLSYLANEEWSTTVSYSDQTLFGDPINTSLGQTLALQLQRRWGR